MSNHTCNTDRLSGEAVTCSNAGCGPPWRSIEERVNRAPVLSDRSTSRPRIAASLLVAGALAISAATGVFASEPGACRTSAAGPPPQIIELYTSEGCNSCPPADAWLNSLRDDPTRIALAFHVDYWDYLGWRDRLADPAYSRRQRNSIATSGARFAYTPQVIVDGRDWRGWPELPLRAGTPSAPIEIVASRTSIDGYSLSFNAQARPTRARLDLWWALVEDGHGNRVEAGENSGATLLHDHVVRRYGTATLAGLPASLSLSIPKGLESGHPQRLVVVVVDPASGQPLQALELGC